MPFCSIPVNITRGIRSSKVIGPASPLFHQSWADSSSTMPNLYMWMNKSAKRVGRVAQRWLRTRTNWRRSSSATQYGRSRPGAHLCERSDQDPAVEDPRDGLTPGYRLHQVSLRNQQRRRHDLSSLLLTTPLASVQKLSTLLRSSERRTGQLAASQCK